MYIKAKSGYSKISCEFMDTYAAKHNVSIQHKHYDALTGVLCGSEHVVDGVSSMSGTTKVDGWIKQSNTILEFHGDYYHGNPNKYDADQWNETIKCTFGDLYESTMERMDNLKTIGYNVIYI
jgi:hypothetical protein